MSAISIIMPIRNCVETIDEALTSIFIQEVSCDVIVVDGNSTDGTKQIIEQNISRIAHFISEPDNGIEDAIQKGLNYVTTEWLLILAGDDALLPHSLIKAALHLDQKVDVLSGSLVYAHNDNRCSMKYSEPDISQLLSYCSLKIPATLFRTTLFKKANDNLINSGLVCATDRERFIRLYEMGASFKCIDTPITLMRGGGLSSMRVLDVVYPEDEKISVAHGVSPWKARQYRTMRSIRFRLSQIQCMQWAKPIWRLFQRSKYLSDKQLSRLCLRRDNNGCVHILKTKCPE